MASDIANDPLPNGPFPASSVPVGNPLEPAPPGTAELQTALDAVKAAGYVVLKEKSYRQAQERQRIAEALRAHAEDDAEHARAWARDCLADERRLRDRLTFVYGVAKAHGATDDEMRAPTHE